LEQAERGGGGHDAEAAMVAGEFGFGGLGLPYFLIKEL
jgi:hypothetical protein